MPDVIVVGAGASGMMAAGIAARRGLDVVLVETNRRPGRKLMITGKGRCNLTNDCDTDEFMSNVPVNGRFLFSAISRFGPADTVAFFESLGVPLKVERGKRVFPVSDKAVDIVDALSSFVRQNGCRVLKGRVTGLITEGGAVKGVRVDDGETVSAGAVVICTGGMSYPLTGSTGDGYRLAQEAGHTVTPLKPSLVPIVTCESWPKDLQGLSLRNVAVKVTRRDGQTVFEELGEMLFTHFGVSGPLILSASSHMRSLKDDGYSIHIDLKPGLRLEQLDLRLQRDFMKYSNCDFKNALHELLPSKMISTAVKLSGIPAELKVNQITKEMRAGFAGLLKDVVLHAEGFRPIEEAIITSGGVDVKEIDPRTMESKKVRGLYFAGEIIDVDAHTGGFNLQIAFSTGYAAGMSVLSN